MNPEIELPTDPIPRPPVHHDLKCWATFFTLSWMGAKPVEIRIDDRPEKFRTDDTITLHELDAVWEGKAVGYNFRKPGEPTGRKIHGRIWLILRNCPGLKEGYVMICWVETRREDRKGNASATPIGNRRFCPHGHGYSVSLCSTCSPVR